MKALAIFSILVLMIGIFTPAMASEPVYEIKCGQDAIDVGALCIMKEKESAEPIKFFTEIRG